MKKILVALMLLTMILSTAQAGGAEKEYAKMISPYLFPETQINGRISTLQFSEKYQSFVFVNIVPDILYQEFTGYQAETLALLVDGTDVFSKPFPNAGIIAVMAKSENEIIWIAARQAGIVFVYDNVAGKVIYSKIDDMPTNVHDFY